MYFSLPPPRHVCRGGGIALAVLTAGCDLRGHMPALGAQVAELGAHLKPASPAAGPRVVNGKPSVVPRLRLLTETIVGRTFQAPFAASCLGLRGVPLVGCALPMGNEPTPTSNLALPTGVHRGESLIFLRLHARALLGPSSIRTSKTHYNLSVVVSNILRRVQDLNL